jgi:hypothetical protein
VRRQLFSWQTPWALEPAYTNKIALQALSLQRCRSPRFVVCDRVPARTGMAAVLPFDYGVPELLHGMYSGAALQAPENVEPAGIYITQHCPKAGSCPWNFHEFFDGA